ncbi:HAD family hydrolase [Halomonas sp. WWR20]
MNATTRYARIEALTFDLDDTLWDNRPVLERAESEHYAWLGEALAALPDVGKLRYLECFPLAAYQRRRGEVATRHPLRRGDYTWIRERAMAELIEEFGLPRSTARLWAAAAVERFLDLRHELDTHPEVAEMLASFRGRYRLAAITNGNANLKRLALAGHFPVMVAAGELRAPKPDARPFLAALARLGTPASHAMHVGDSWREDVLPAQRLGMQAAWIDVHGADDRPLPPGVHRLSHIRELPALLEALQASP